MTGRVHLDLALDCVLVIMLQNVSCSPEHNMLSRTHIHRIIALISCLYCCKISGYSRLLVSHHDLGQKIWIQSVAIVGIGVLKCSKVLNLQRRNLIFRPCLDQAVELEVVILHF